MQIGGPIQTDSKFNQSEEIQVTQTQPVSTNNTIYVSCNQCGYNNSRVQVL